MVYPVSATLFAVEILMQSYIVQSEKGLLMDLHNGTQAAVRMGV